MVFGGTLGHLHLVPSHYSEGDKTKDSSEEFRFSKYIQQTELAGLQFVILPEHLTMPHCVP